MRPATLARRSSGPALALAIALATALGLASGCDEATITVRGLEPPYGPIAGGSLTTVVGRGFEASGAPPLVLFGGRQAPLVITVDDSHLTVLTPPGAGPGDVDVQIVIGDRVARAASRFRYSAPPVITDVSPGDVFLEAGTTRVTVRGHGFLDEGAGPPTLLVDGAPIEVTVDADDQLTFVAPEGWPLREPFLELINLRGGTTFDRAFRYVPGRPGLLLFSVSLFDRFAVYLDPVSLRTAAAPRFGTIELAAAARDGDGAYWALDFAGRLGRLDLSEQQLVTPVVTGRSLSTLEWVGDGLVTFDEGNQRLGRVDGVTGEFTQLSSWQPEPGPVGLAFDGSRLLVVSLEQESEVTALRAIDVASGAVGPPITLDLPPFTFLDELRFHDGVLYAIGSGVFVTIDPTTGATTALSIPDLAGFGPWAMAPWR